MRPKTGRIGSGEHSPRFRNKETRKDPDARFLSVGLREGMTISLELRKLVRKGDAPPAAPILSYKARAGGYSGGSGVGDRGGLAGLAATSPADAAPRFKTVSEPSRTQGSYRSRVRAREPLSLGDKRERLQAGQDPGCYPDPRGPRPRLPLGRGEASTGQQTKKPREDGRRAMDTTAETAMDIASTCRGLAAWKN